MAALDQIDVLLKVVAALDRLSIPYYIGGSYASSAHGIARATADIDVVAVIRRDQAGDLVTELGTEFYADDLAIKRAIALRRHFNVIHTEAVYKVDVFAARPDRFEEEQLKRRQKVVLDDKEGRTVYLATAEDTILAKLRWYQRSGRALDQQWRDVLGVARVQADKLDIGYMRRWAVELGVSELLEKLLQEA